MYNIDYNSYRSIKSFNRRSRFLVMHYTALNFEKAIQALTGELVSAHYLVPNPEDPTYQAAGFNKIHIFNLVDEIERAWHAGISSWAGREGLNDTSIGIEIVNEASEDCGIITFPPYNPEQIEAIKELAINILQRYPDITPTHVVGHSDIAWQRKTDPGPSFPWKALYDAGIGAWYDEETKQKYIKQFDHSLPDRTEILKKFKRYGYGISEAEKDEYFPLLIRAFQMHFRPSFYDGMADIETIAILYSLVEKYFVNN
ncbi:N-acetylmuramoyl-L-alanine amidase [Xenorhabdus nematophila]|uniref:N-acetylmuramoyl-L-alanine amidase n=1 Tax=Xenorhabdus nematophila (strain ATCC 19061 / DSM 3370 / CCUG 14189 / LMG 1036 / NCIMB 9965 / AN6) TaxID=406817 RepID=D3VJ58_XENNA|nr:N-acetylmuramoyl-L-alanine amidase [Xenorhabdus nematophila]CEF32037.1 putative amidase [Xenorhabdus nematophila str. Websteri]AYA39831.1 N-acetylmuramoyl-L-alanine amidase [Xenorhabdus nematophila]KHD29041.1 N-acetylmuramoyl-L-alanine amidase [Xenorhabdus nematophila]MBA0018397.1 N-acetylmuramoyl-L-alanine amidase [Xenorhabdus nematophila]MCB4425523.1 N-acetylmuramoyl-L-alanine amidase [Xenorhabdus nematophila]